MSAVAKLVSPCGGERVSRFARGFSLLEMLATLLVFSVLGLTVVISSEVK